MKWICFALLSPALHLSIADAETAAAVEVVQKEMRHPKFHEEAAKTSLQATEVEKQVKDLAGSPENEQAMYNLAADVLGNMKDQSPEQMLETLQKAKQNPEAFWNSLTPEQKAELKELSERIPAGKGIKP